MIAKNMTKLRNERSMSLYDLSHATGVAYSALYYIEHGGRDIHISTAVKIARGLQCKVDDLIDESVYEDDNHL